MNNLTSYSQLQAAMQKYMKRQDLNALVPTFIGLAEEWLDENIYTLARETSYVFTPLQSVNPLPSDYKRIRRVYANGELLDPFPTDFDSSYANGTIPTIGNGYQLISGNLVLSVPQLTKVQIDYYAILEGLSDTNVSNWLFEDSPNTYLWASLVQAAIYMRDATLQTTWDALLQRSIGSYTADDDKARYADGPLTMRAG